MKSYDCQMSSKYLNVHENAAAEVNKLMHSMYKWL